MHSRLNIVSAELLRCKRELQSMTRLQAEMNSTSSKGTLIISTGDISDVDGFFALAEYAKTGATVLFIMNYPAYLGVESKENTRNDPGLGFTYDINTYLSVSESIFKDEGKIKSYSTLKQKYSPFNMHTAFTDMAMSMAARVWTESGGDPCNFYFCVGGINSVNPFSASTLKNELYVYADMVSDMKCSVRAYKEHSIYSHDKTLSEYTPETFLLRFNAIYMDFNGSMAFYDPEWESVLEHAAKNSKINAVVIMGGVYSNKTPQTLAATSTLNRLSCATMNQLYHKEYTGNFLKTLDKHKVQVFVVTNNDVVDLMTHSDAEKKIKSDFGWTSFLEENKLKSPFLKEISSAYYNSQYAPPRKAFDFYTALIISYMISHNGCDNLVLSNMNVFYNAETGATVVSELGMSANSVIKQYIHSICTHISDSRTPEFRRSAFIPEIPMLNELKTWNAIKVSAFLFEMDRTTYCLGVACATTVYPNKPVGEIDLNTLYLLRVLAREWIAYEKSTSDASLSTFVKDIQHAIGDTKLKILHSSRIAGLHDDEFEALKKWAGSKYAK
jgi:hypothetical protein